MRKKDREIIDKEKIEQIIQSCDCCRIGLVDKDKPYIIPLNFAYINEAVSYTHLTLPTSDLV